MDKKTYEALKRVIEKYRNMVFNKKIEIKEFNDLKTMKDWIDEVAKEYEEETKSKGSEFWRSPKD